MFFRVNTSVPEVPVPAPGFIKFSSVLSRPSLAAPGRDSWPGAALWKVHLTLQHPLLYRWLALATKQAGYISWYGMSLQLEQPPVDARAL